MLSRRMLLSLAAVGTAGCDSSQSLTTLAPSGTPAKSTPATLVVVFQRFAADWINLLVPAGDSAYATVRRGLRIDNPLPLDGYFGLHPLLAPLQGLYDAGTLAFITATGWMPTEARDRSHFFAQAIAEAGARSGVSDGWLGRFMRRDSLHSDGLWAALAAEASVPASLHGYANALAVRDFSLYTHGSSAGGAATDLLAVLAGVAGAPGDTTQRLARSMQSIAASPPPRSDIPYPNSTLGQGLKVAAEAIRGGLAPRVITVTSDDDWDTHVSQASRHAQSLPRFAAALRAFHDDLGDAMENVVLVTMTEFGRKAVENFGGTDHGTASSMLVMGRSVAGRQIYGQWPGLHASALYQGEDLEPSTDFRSVLGEILVRHMGFAAADVDAVFPGGYGASSHWRNFLLSA